MDDFGVKYLGKKHRLHPKEALETKYRVTTDWEGKLYIEIALKWDYKKETVKLSMSVYVRVGLHSFQYEKPKRPHELPYP